MSVYESLRQSNIARNRALIADLGIKQLPSPVIKRKREESAVFRIKRRKVESTAIPRPTRTSARIASAVTIPSYKDEDTMATHTKSTATRRSATIKQSIMIQGSEDQDHDQDQKRKNTTKRTDVELDSLRKSWSSWTPTAPPPTRSHPFGPFHFPSHPTFTPNKSPSEMLHEGVFGGSYFRTLYSRTLDTTITDDWHELPHEWTAGLEPSRFLTQADYDASVNKYGVKCGQSIEEWEAAGWIEHRFDVRGWFQWYCRFFLGRRCEDDERQVGRWSRCVGERGRFRRALLKQYRQLGIRDVAGQDDEDEEAMSGKEVSRVVSQTCLQWGWEVRQEDLDAFWLE